MSELEVQIKDLCPALKNALPAVKVNGPEEVDVDLKKRDYISICAASGVEEVLSIQVDYDTDFYIDKNVKINVVCEGCKLLKGGFKTQIEKNIR